MGLCTKLLFWVFKWTNHRKLNFHIKNILRAVATFWLAAVNLIFGRMTRQGMDYIGQSKLPN